MISRATPRRPAWPRAAAFLAFAAVWVLAPKVAEAGCRDHRAGSRGVTPSAVERFVAGDSAAEAIGGPLRPTAPPEAPPCTGAFCSGSPAVPAPSTAVPLVPIVSWAILDEPRDDRAAGSFPHFAGEPLRLPSRPSVPIFHPPRTVAATSL